MKRVVTVASRTPKKAKNLAAGLQKIKNSTKILFCGDFLLFFLKSIILLHHLAAIFKKNYLHARPVIPFELGETLILPTKKEGSKDVFVSF